MEDGQTAWGPDSLADAFKGGFPAHAATVGIDTTLRGKGERV